MTLPLALRPLRIGPFLVATVAILSGAFPPAERPARADERAPHMGDVVFDIALESVTPSSIFHGDVYNNSVPCYPNDPKGPICQRNWDVDYASFSAVGRDGAGSVIFRGNAPADNQVFAHVHTAVGPVPPIDPAGFQIRNIVMGPTASERLDLAFSIDSRNADGVRDAFATRGLEPSQLIASQAYQGNATVALANASGPQRTFLPPLPSFQDPGGFRPLWTQATDGVYMTNPVVPLSRVNCDGYVAAGKLFVTGDQLWQRTANGPWRVTVRYDSFPITCIPTPELPRYPASSTPMIATDVTFRLERREIPYPPLQTGPFCADSTTQSWVQGTSPSAWPGDWTSKGAAPTTAPVHVRINSVGTAFDVHVDELAKGLCPAMPASAASIPLGTGWPYPEYAGEQYRRSCPPILRLPIPLPLSFAARALLIPPIAPGPVRLGADALVVSPRITILAYRDTCADGTQGLMRLRYVRTRDDGTIETDSMLSRYTPPPR